MHARPLQVAGHLGELQRRELVASAEVSDMLLDLRMILTFIPAEPASVN